MKAHLTSSPNHVSQLLLGLQPGLSSAWSVCLLFVCPTHLDSTQLNSTRLDLKMADKPDKVKDYIKDRFDKLEDEFEKTNSWIEHVRNEVGNLRVDLANERAGREARDKREETETKPDYKTDDDDTNDLDKVECTGIDDCGCWLCESYREDKYDSGDVEDDKDKTVKRVNRVRYYDDSDNSDDGDDVEASDSNWNDEDFEGLGFTSEEDD